MLLTFKLLDMKNELNSTELRFLLTGGVALGAEYPECPATWMTKQAWGEMCRACDLKSFKGFAAHFAKHANEEYKELYDMPDPSEFKFPEEADTILSDFTKLIVIRIIKPDKLVPAMVRFVV
jgi:dynein heavy chain